ncbi:MAG: hypothetical protein Q4D63_06650 [Neisseria animaloris]|nr:hypothetical protein [Neisseria animaloris]
MGKINCKQKIMIFINEYRYVFGFILLFLLIFFSIFKDYNFGFLVGFLLISLICFLPEIKKLIVDFKISEIYGVKFNHEVLKGDIRQVLENEGEFLNESTLDKVATVAVNRMIKTAPHNLYEQDIASVLHDLGLPFNMDLTLYVGKNKCICDFVVDIESNENVQSVFIEAMHIQHSYLFRREIERISKIFSTIYEIQGKIARFLIVSNKEIRSEDLDKISSKSGIHSQFINSIHFNGNKDVLFKELKIYFNEIKNE